MRPENELSVRDAVVRRRMVRAFTEESVDPVVLDGLIDLARRAPSAGNSQGSAFVVLSGPAETSRYWDVALPDERRAAFRWSGLVAAPVLIVVVVRPETWVERYREPDKVATGLGASAEAWAVPYWWVDGGMAVENLLLACVAEGLGACFFGLFDHERAVLDALGVPADRRALGAVALGWPAPDSPGRSVGRPRRSDAVHRGRW